MRRSSRSRPTTPRPSPARSRRGSSNATELWCSIGIGDNKLQAKIATDAGKPAGVFMLTSDRWTEWMGPRPTDALWGIGWKTARRLATIGIRTVDELASGRSRSAVGTAFGPSTGPGSPWLARGEDASQVSDAPWIPKGVSRERTFQQDLATHEEVLRELDRIALETAEDVLKDGRPAARVVVKVRSIPFITKTRGFTLPVADERSRGHRGRCEGCAGAVPGDRAARAAARRARGVRRAGCRGRRPRSSDAGYRGPGCR